MKCVVIGAGQWGVHLVKQMQSLGVLAGVVESSEARQSEIATIVPGVKFLPTLEDALTSDANALVIATPAATHFEIALQALQAGKDVFVEKPLTLRSQEAQILQEAAKTQGRILMVGHLLLYSESVREFQKAIREGVIGKFHSLHIRRLKYGRIRSVENVLWSFGVHDLAVMLEVFGEEPIQVKGEGQRFVQAKIEDDVKASFQFSEGRTAHLHVSWLWPECERKMVAIGSEGALVYDEMARSIQFFKQGKFIQTIYQGQDEDILKSECQHFLKCIKERSSPLSDASSGVKVVKLLERIEANLHGQN